jgi:hypothetical protein
VKPTWLNQAATMICYSIKMKRFLLILSLLLTTSAGIFAQADDENDADEKIKDKMSEYIQKRLSVSKGEAAKFTPVFLRYFKDWRQTLRETKSLPALDRQSKIVELRLRYRTEFRGILGERRGDQVYVFQERFIQELREVRRERMRDNPPTRRRP